MALPMVAMWAATMADQMVGQMDSTSADDWADCLAAYLVDSTVAQMVVLKAGHSAVQNACLMVATKVA